MASKNGRPSLTEPVRAIIYRRISDDATGEEAGVTRQDKDCQEYCARKGWIVVANLVDNDISASRYAKRKRPGYTEALHLLETGQADALVAYHLDRLWRRPVELEHLIDLAEKSNITVATLNGDIDLTTGDGRFQARILVSVAAKASDDMSRRIRRKKEALALEGLPSTDIRSFGWNRANMQNGVRVGERGGMIQIPEEAVAIRDAAKRFLAGETLASIARRWDEHGFSTSQGAKGWSTTTVKSVLSNPRNCGLRYANGEYVGKAAWDPIISETTWRRIVAKLADPGRQQTPKRVTLLTGIVHCGKCGHVMSRNYLKDGTAVLTCRKRVGSDKGCNGVSISVHPLEKLIVESIMLVVDTPAMATTVRDKPTADEEMITNEITGLESSLALRLEMFDAGDINRGEYLSSTKRLRDRLTRLQSLQSASTKTAALLPYQGKAGALKARWDSLTLEERRVVLKSAIENIVIAPATRRGQGLDPSRISISWAA